MRRGARGFTLAELLVSMSIFAVLTAVVMVNFRVGERGDELRLGAARLAALIRDAEARASSGVTACVCLTGGPGGPLCGAGRSCSGGGTATDVVPDGGYGVHIGLGDPEAVLFADLDASRTYTVGEELERERLSPSAGVRAQASGGDVVFVPPRPEVWINGTQAPTEFSVTLEQLLSGARRALRYNRISRRIEQEAL